MRALRVAALLAAGCAHVEPVPVARPADARLVITHAIPRCTAMTYAVDGKKVFERVDEGASNLDPITVFDAKLPSGDVVVEWQVTCAGIGEAGETSRVPILKEPGLNELFVEVEGGAARANVDYVIAE